MHSFNILYTSVELQSQAVVFDNDKTAVNLIRWMKAKPIDVLSVRGVRGQEVWNVNNSGMNIPDLYNDAMDFTKNFSISFLRGREDVRNMHASGNIQTSTIKS